MARPSKDHVELLHDYGIHIPTRTLVLEGAVDDDGEETGVTYTMAMKFLKNMHLLEAGSKDPITVIMNTGGGDVGQGMAIYDRIAESECYITIIVYGYAQSMGSIILQAADARVLAPSAQIMFHLGEGEPATGNPYEILSAAQWDVAVSERVDEILYDRIKAKHDADNKAFTKNKYKDLNFKGKYMSATEAVELGLADRVET